VAEEQRGAFQEFVSRAEAFASKSEPFLKLIPAGLGAIYLVGFVVVALNLAGYGASPLDLIKIQYLAAGFWCGLVCLVYLGVRTFLRSIFSEMFLIMMPKATWGRSIASILAPIMTVVMLVLNATSLYVVRRIPWAPLHREGGVADSTSFPHLIGPSIVCLAFVDIMLQLCLWLREKPRQLGKVRVFYWFLLFASVASLAVGFSSYLQSFARDVYSHISFSFGGGQARRVIFWLGASTGAADSFLERDGTQPYTVPYELLVENESSLIVIKRDSVQSSSIASLL
jgi:hypothetical protein